MCQLVSALDQWKWVDEEPTKAANGILQEILQEGAGGEEVGTK